MKKINLENKEKNKQAKNIQSKKTKIFKLILLILVILICAGAILYLFPVMKNLSTQEGQIVFKQKIEDSGILGVLMLFGMQFAQIFLIIVPGEPIEILSGMCYGGLWGTIFIMISSAIISTIIFLLVRKLGKKFVYDFCNREKVEKIEKSKLFQNPQKIETIMIILFLIPGTPKDLLVYIAALLPIKPARFIITTTLARFPSIISSTLAGEHLAVGNWKMSLILYASVLLIVGIIIFFINKFDKNKITKEAINTIK